VKSFIEGGPYVETADAMPANYPSKHFSNPDGLNFLYVNGKTYMVIEEDLNGTSMGRMPNTGVNTTNCEAWLLDMSKEPTIDNLYRLAISPFGSEITGIIQVDEGNTVLINSQHPSTLNVAPFNNSLTFAISGLKSLISSIERDETEGADADDVRISPNPTATEITFRVPTDAALYDAAGARVRVVRSATMMDVSDLASGSYYVMLGNGTTKQVVISR
jgi:secreted PhoX family phosphatase